MGNSQNSSHRYPISIAVPISLCPSMMYFDIQAIHLISYPNLHLFVQPDLFFLVLLSGTNPIVSQPFWYYLSHSRLFCLTSLLPFSFFIQIFVLLCSSASSFTTFFTLAPHLPPSGLIFNLHLTISPTHCPSHLSSQSYLHRLYILAVYIG